MYTGASTCPHSGRTFSRRGRGNQRSACRYFALPSEQAVNLCLASAYLRACHPSPAQGERHHTPQPSRPRAPPPPPPLPSHQLSSPWLSGGGGCRLNYSLRSISSKFAFIFAALSLLFCCVCFLSGSRSESVSACCVISYRLRRRPAMGVMQRENGRLLVLEQICRGIFPEAPLWHRFKHAVCVSVCTVHVRLPTGLLHIQFCTDWWLS